MFSARSGKAHRLICVPLSSSQHVATHKLSFCNHAVDLHTQEIPRINLALKNSQASDIPPGSETQLGQFPCADSSGLEGLSELCKDPETGHSANGDDVTSRDGNNDPKSGNLAYKGTIRSGPRALQPNMSPRTLRSIPTGPANSFPPGHPENRSKHSSSSADTTNTHTAQNGYPARNGPGQDHARSRNEAGD
ncbi:hypothetical protein PTTG_05643 [Puccinia triticina 1-1 BBBD Race 1]|uniref:Uncharacterized protein n=2 Tax=Puccinia triticina TaxID=208348 RepID=A0A180G3B9_PUCT1|nr:uncharacterized protein PtA15_4A403 [Puccinia triticina]OAV87147.1 hypothetical protein PTTG_05643 [Puccinia triticina 1-1 BBBD Race 1]WAQ83952.1 hypothetical protein PtA15_4A403 [Puccinia triticina]WAR59600.1 hypothetical protein PtB15_11B240 [Puccinia triticina]